MMKDVSDSCEAVFIACEMEKRAVRFCERALTLLLTKEVNLVFQAILQEEREHLRCFSSLLAGTKYSVGSFSSLSQKAIDMFFGSGLMKAHQENAFDSQKQLLAYAVAQKAQTIAQYEEWLLQCEGEQALTMGKILQTEKAHLLALATQGHL